MRRMLSTLIATVALAGCGLTEDLASIDGIVRTPQGQPIAGAEVRVYAFGRNLRHLSAQKVTGNRLNADNYRARVSIDRLERGGEVAGVGITGPDGRYQIDGLPGDAIIVIASKGGTSKDIAGMDLDDGTVSLSSALKPVVGAGDENSLLGSELHFRANFTMEVPPESTAPTGAGQDVAEGGGPQVEELTPPADAVSGRWESFVIEDVTGTVLADASSAEAMIDADLDQVRDGAAIRIRGRFSDPSVTKAFIRVQQGASQCADSGLDGKVVNIEVTLKDGVITSSQGDFQQWFLSGGIERYQLDIDTESENGNESDLVRIDTACVVQTHPMTITLMWDQEDVDVDLYVWDFNQEETYYETYYDGEQGRSSYGKMTQWADRGRGPEVFKLNPGESGRYCVRAHVFCGPNANTKIKARIQHWKNGKWQDKTFQGSLSLAEEWIDIGIFAVDPME